MNVYDHNRIQLQGALSDLITRFCLNEYHVAKKRHVLNLQKIALRSTSLSRIIATLQPAELNMVAVNLALHPGLIRHGLTLSYECPGAGEVFGRFVIAHQA